VGRILLVADHAPKLPDALNHQGQHGHDARGGSPLQFFIWKSMLGLEVR
jgi:hypothetical protein